MGNKAFFNSIYSPQIRARNERTNKSEVVKNDFIMMLLKDVETGDTEIQFEPRPTMPVYFTKENERYPMLSYPEEGLVKHNVKYAEKNLDIAKYLNVVNDFFTAAKNKYLPVFIKEMTSHPNVYLGDMDIEDYYKTYYTFKYGDFYPQLKLRNSFLDIEVDISNYSGFPEEDIAPCQVNLINYFYEPTKTMYSFILRDPRSPECAQIEKDPSNFIINNVKQDLYEDDFDCNYEFHFFDTEQELLVKIFQKIHETKPDFCGIWNMKFDILTLINRCGALGITPESIMCHPDVPEEYRMVRFKQDRGNEKTANYSKLWHWVDITGYTQFYDQMSMYSKLRIKNFPSYTLDSISKKELKFGKVDLHDLGYGIKDVNIKSFSTFLRYGIQDVYLQYRLEKKLKDLNQFVVFSGTTRLQKGFSPSYIIKSMFAKYFMERGRVIGSNIPLDDGTSGGEKKEGAIVANPKNLIERGVEIMGKESSLFKAVVDFDAASMYPNLKIAFYIAKNSLYGRLMEVVDKNNEVVLGKGSKFNHYLTTIETSIFKMGEEFFGLPPIENVVEDFQNKIGESA